MEIYGPTLILGDNKSVALKTAAMPSFALKKKYNNIAYHRVQEAIAASIIKFMQIPSEKAVVCQK